MANIIIKSEEQKQYEAYVLSGFKQGANITSSDREAAACIAARSSEAYSKLKKLEEKRR